MVEPGCLITVALCTHNHEDRLRVTLAALRTLQAPRGTWELLVVDNASTDGTPAQLSSTEWHPPGVPTRTILEPKLGLSNARNRAIAEAAGEYVLFIDDDETPDPAWLAEYARAILDWKPDALGGPIDVMFIGAPRPSWLDDDLLGFLGKLDHGSEARWLTTPETKIFGGNFAFRRTTFEAVGTFDATLGRVGGANFGGEDTDLYRRMLAAGCRIRWVPTARIVHRIEAGKLRRSYFLDLHFRQGRIEGQHKRGNRHRVPPAYLVPQLWRAFKAALSARLRGGADRSLRKEMNFAYFVGYFRGWLGD